MAKADDTETNLLFTIRIWKKSSIGTQYTSDQHNGIKAEGRSRNRSIRCVSLCSCCELHHRSGFVDRWRTYSGPIETHKFAACKRQQNTPINRYEVTQEINMLYENRFLFMSLAIAGLALGGCTASADGGVREAHRDMTVTCTSTVAYDVGVCQILANARCEEGRAQLRGVLSSTFLPANKLYLNTARYRCLSA
ncbi:hypothetical protein WA1_02930 [Scytonema hofmannii PCC 7110]|uniref:Uncharacterized protein n=1 Tax=Scytonema hofmannii PCC 7110 TaxID=128403 RepID=A0A139XHE5_9CYAN|nr:hypothetical protein WA1_02930 [Scytonema hofmannii PCC 7110]